jgi:O-antigen ligase
MMKVKGLAIPCLDLQRWGVDCHSLCKVRAWLFICLAITLQIQLTLFTSPSYFGLRVALSDLALPVAGIAILAMMLRHKTTWPNWECRTIDFWMVGSVAIFSVALWQGMVLYETPQIWSLVNRYLGWLVIIAYVYLAGWLATQTDSGDQIKIFASVLCFFCFITFAIYTAHILPIDPLGKQRWKVPGYPVDVLMENRNAFAFLFCTALVLMGAALRAGIQLVPMALFQAFLVIMPIAFVYNGSRAGWIITALLLVLAGCTMGKLFWRRLFPCIAVGLIACLALYAYSPKAVFREKQFESFEDIANLAKPGEQISSAKTARNYYPDATEAPKTEIARKGDQLRVFVWQDALDLWHTRPVLGAGLGNFLEYQKAKYGQYYDQIDNAPLWLLTEMGLLGLTFFAAFYIWVFTRLLSQMRKGLPSLKWLYEALLVLMLVFALFSLVHQIMFARVFWFLLGLGLALPKPQISA